MGLLLVHNIHLEFLEHNKQETRQEVDYRHLKWGISVNIQFRNGHFENILTIYVLSKNSNDTSQWLFFF